jgi:hypothetical protein
LAREKILKFFFQIIIVNHCKLREHFIYQLIIYWENLNESQRTR